MEKLVVVSRRNKVLGHKGKDACHTLKGILHQGFSVFVFNKKGEVLLQKRNKSKKLWPGFWSNTCCSHPHPGETYIQAGERRLKEELGFTCKLKNLGKFYYRAVYKNIGSENEICAVLLGEYNGKISLNPKEAAEYRFVSLKNLRKEIEEKPEIFTPWLEKEISLFLRQEK